MEHMAFGANAKFDTANEFGAEFEKNGAYHNATTSRVGMIYYADCAEFEWDRVLDLQKTAITTPKFLKEELVAEAGNVEEELTGYLSNPNRVLWLRIGKAVGERLLLDSERLKTIENITVDNIREHYKKTHTTNNMRFIVAGPLAGRKRKLIETLENWRLPKGKRLDVISDENHSSPPILVRRKEIPNMIFGLSFFLGERIDYATADAMEALDHILTGTLHSRMLGRARSNGLAYGMWSNTSYDAHASDWSFGGQVSLKSAEKLFNIICEELTRVLEGDISKKDVRSAQLYALGKHQMGAQTAAQIASWYSNDYFFDDTILHFSSQPRRIRAVTKEKIVTAAEQFLHSGCLALGSIGSPDRELLDRLQAKLDKVVKK